MKSDIITSAQRVAKMIQKEVAPYSQPPSEIIAPPNQPVLPHSLFAGSRGYIEKIVFQINNTYTHACYDACAVMIRRLVEVLIIEAFEHIGEADKIKNQTSGDYLYLQDLIAIAAGEPKWKLGRNTKHGLTKLKTIGDQSAHSRRYNARRLYIDDVVMDLRTVTEEFLYLGGMKK